MFKSWLLKVQLPTFVVSLQPYKKDMRTKSLKKNRINVVTLGCSKNVYDSEVLMGQLKASGKDVVHEEEGNVVVINTCGFINNAKEESINTILHYMNKKEDGEVDKVFVTGCLSERYKPELQKEIRIKKIRRVRFRFLFISK